MPGSSGPVQRWDPVVRALHWALAALVAFDLVRDDGDFVHRVAGYVAAGVVGARLLWALLSAGNARLSELRPSLRATLAYLRGLFRGRPQRHAGHDPLGLWMVWLLWLLVLLLGLTGWMSRWDAFWGDERLQAVHAWLADALLVAAAVHVLAVVVMSWAWKENLPRTMITGFQRSPPDD
jgi:cytochrome b